MLVYIAYPTSLTLRSANAIQTYATLRELRARCPNMVALIPRWGREPSRFEEVGAIHLPRPAIGKLSRFYKSTLLYYLEHTIFAWMTAAWLVPRRRAVRAVYVRQVVAAAWWSAVLGPRLNLPVIYEAHDLETRNPSRAREPWAEGLLHLLDRAALTRSTAVVSLTEDFRRVLAVMGWRDPADVFVIPDAYDERVFTPQARDGARATLGLSLTAPVVAYAGMTFAHRWVDGLVAAVAQLRERYPDLTLILVGGQETERAALGAEARRLGLSAALHLVPPCPQTEVVRWLAAADVLAIPDTVTDTTASPLKLFEYLALGQPLVIPALPALHEIVPPALCHTFPRRDLNGLIKALDAALAAAPDSAGAEARRRLAAAYTYGRRAERIIAVVEHVA